MDRMFIGGQFVHRESDQKVMEAVWTVRVRMRTVWVALHFWWAFVALEVRFEVAS